VIVGVEFVDHVVWGYEEGFALGMCEGMSVSGVE
jgi:hypothetical protein